MPEIVLSHFYDKPEKGLKYACEILNICLRYALAMSICLRYTLEILKIYMRCSSDMPDIYIRYTYDIPVINLRHGRDMVERLLIYT